jgi:hypothetical protein
VPEIVSPAEKGVFVQFQGRFDAEFHHFLNPLLMNGMKQWKTFEMKFHLGQVKKSMNQAPEKFLKNCEHIWVCLNYSEQFPLFHPTIALNLATHSTRC